MAGLFHAFFSEGNLVFDFVRPNAPKQEEEFQNDKTLLRSQLFFFFAKNCFQKLQGKLKC